MTEAVVQTILELQNESVIVTYLFSAYLLWNHPHPFKIKENFLKQCVEGITLPQVPHQGVSGINNLWEKIKDINMRC